MLRQPAPRPSGQEQPTQLGSAADRRWRALPLFAALLFSALALHAARRETPTIDEFAHVAAAHALLDQGRFDLYGKSPPWGRALLALPSLLDARVAVPQVAEPAFGWGPWRYGDRFMRANAEHYFAIVFRARAMVVVLALLCAGLVFVWARDLFGERAAALASALFLLQPSLLAHGHLATLDVASTASIFASAQALRSACRRASSARLCLAGALWGAALLVKFTALLLLPAFAALLLWAHGPRWRRAALELLLLLGVALFTLNAGMGFRGSFRPLSDHDFASAFGRSLSSWLPAATPVPLPFAWLRGFDAQKLDVEQGEFASYSLGRWSREGVPYYEPLAFVLKTPLPMLALLLALPFALWQRPPPRLELAFLLLPLLVLGVLLTGMNALNVGVRYLLPLYPFAFVLVAALFDAGRRLLPLLGLAALAAHVATALWVHPAYLSYFNLAAGGSSQGHRYLLDSNFDWGQDLYRLRPALDELGVEGPVALLYFGHVDARLYGVDYVIAPREPFEGILAASVSYVKGFAYPVTTPDGRLVPVRGDHLAWLAGREPLRKLGSLWLYDLRPGAPR